MEDLLVNPVVLYRVHRTDSLDWIGQFIFTLRRSLVVNESDNKALKSLLISLWVGEKYLHTYYI